MLGIRWSELQTSKKTKAALQLDRGVWFVVDASSRRLPCGRKTGLLELNSDSEAFLAPLETKIPPFQKKTLRTICLESPCTIRLARGRKTGQATGH